MEFDRSVLVETDFGNLKIYLSGPLVNDLVLFHHGAGYTAQTWLGLIRVLSKSFPGICFAAFDMRGHGQSDKASSFNLEDLVEDVQLVIPAVLKQFSVDSNAAIDTFLIGHSLGAAVLASFANKKSSSNLNIKLHGLVMIDIIEDTAIGSLERMPTILQDIPKSFKDIDTATKWATSSSHSHHFHGIKASDVIIQSLESQLKLNCNSDALEWITDLSDMEPYWNSWFTNLTANFLSFPGSRMLVVANNDYMDNRMMIAQMQGKFQMIIVKDSGHAIQEDKPEDLAEYIAVMIRKHLKLLEILRNK